MFPVCRVPKDQLGKSALLRIDKGSPRIAAHSRTCRHNCNQYNGILLNYTNLKRPYLTKNRTLFNDICCISIGWKL